MSENYRPGQDTRSMFDRIAPRYDLLNSLLSFGCDRYWRNAAVRELALSEPRLILDVATGTGKVARAAACRYPRATVVGVDLSANMLRTAQRKLGGAEPGRSVTLAQASCEALPFAARSFDGVLIAFGIRNVVDRLAGLREMRRVLKPGGTVVILEFSNPQSRFFKALYQVYFRRVLPFLGGLFSQRGAYRYLPDSVLGFPHQEAFKALMQKAGFSNVRHVDLTFGIATVYVGARMD